MIDGPPHIPVVPIDRCDLCDNTRGEIVSERDRYGYPVRFLRCRCGLYRNSHRPADLCDFYNQHYRDLVSSYHGREINAKTIQADQMNYAEEVAAFLHPRRYGELLDVGGSTGVVGQHLANEWGGVATVLEPCREELAEAHCCERICEVAEEFDPAGRRWDIALLCQTIDHLLSPLSVLHMLNACCDSLYVDAVDVELFDDKQEAAKIDHIWGFTDKTCRQMFLATGWQVISNLTRNKHRVYLCVR